MSLFAKELYLDVDYKSRKEIKKILPLISKIVSLREGMLSLSDEELKNKTKYFKYLLKKGLSLDSILVEAFAVMREANRRIFGKEPYVVQLIGAVLLHQGRIAELKTGEGKTLLATLPAYLNALTGKGVHVVSVNEYLTKRDYEEMSQVFGFLGLSTGLVLSGMSLEDKKKAYQSDITYVTNSEVGFDYLRDNIAKHSNDLVQRGLVYAIIDEVDSVLIDEARTPLIISNNNQKDSLLLGTCDILAKQLVKGISSEKFNKSKAVLGYSFNEDGDFIVDDADKLITLTESGIRKVENYLHLDNLYDEKNNKMLAALLTSLKAHYLMKKDIDYVVKNGEVCIVDTFTGRIMEGRRYSDGLHQAIEVKEGVKIKEDSLIKATITYQNFFNKYQKKSGMTGTGKTEEDELKDIYFLDVISVPTNKPIKRVDKPDLVFLTKEDKYQAICDDVENSYLKKQPVLVGTPSVKESEELSKLLNIRGIPHSVLNAKQDKEEALIVSKAGGLQRVTIATNMAGRGTDILLSEESKALGGLKVIGVERHESKQIDLQLRGRSGRQGDVGESQFYTSLEDEWLIFFATPKELSRLKKIVSGKTLFRAKKESEIVLNNIQKRIELNHFSVRKQVFEYDSVINEHRNFVYSERKIILTSKDLIAYYEKAVSQFIYLLFREKNKDFKEIKSILSHILDFPLFDDNLIYNFSLLEFRDIVLDRSLSFYNDRIKLFDKKELYRYQKELALRTLDDKWIEHLNTMDYLKQFVSFSSYAQKDPRLEYNRVSEQLLNNLIYNYYQEILILFFKK